MDLFLAMVTTALDLRLQGEAGPEAGPKVAEHPLHRLGVPAERALERAWREIERAWREIEPLRFERVALR